jgi:hypothetical protein
MSMFEARTAIVFNLSYVSPNSARLKLLLGKRASDTRLLTCHSFLAADARSVANCLKRAITDGANYCQQLRLSWTW